MPAELQLRQAIEAFERGDLDRALTLANQDASVSSGPERNHLIGLIHCRQGDPERGVEYLRLALDAEPANTGYKVMLARALIDSGRAADVLRMRRPPTNPNPTELALWMARAEAAGAIGSDEAAAEAWAVAATHRKIDPDAWISLARSQFALKRFSEAEDACRRAISLSPHSVGGFLTLGLIYERTNRIEELDQLLDEASRHGLSKESLAYLWALREHRAGHLQSARDFLSQSDPAQDPVRWHWLRARIADKEGDPTTAVEAMTAMNRATANFELWRQRGAAFRGELRALAAVMTPEWASRIPRLDSSPGRVPVFLVGLPRSGTTLLDTFLMGHPAIEVLEEKEILRRAGQLAGPLSQLSDSSKTALVQARAAYLDEFGAHVSPDFEGKVIDKNPFNIVLAPLIHALFAGAPVLFSSRHPCDAVLSGFMQSFIPNIGMASFLDLSDAADLYDAVMTIWVRATELFHLNMHSVAYEDLIEDPERNLREILDFMGLAWDERVMDHRATAKARGALANTSYDQVTEPLFHGAAGRWRRYEAQLEPVLPILLPWAKRLGYPD